MSDSHEAIRASYDRVAGDYAAQCLDELAGKPLDRSLLDAFAEAVRGGGPVLDVGCGPGQVARYLAERGAAVEGLDLSPEMIAVAQRHHPDIRFRAGNLFALPHDAESLAGLVAFYAIVHVPPDELGSAFHEFRRVLAPAGRLLLSFHIGTERIHRDDWWDKPVTLDFWFFPRALVEERLHDAGFEIEARLERKPYPDIEYQSERAYLLARPSCHRPRG